MLGERSGSMATSHKAQNLSRGFSILNLILRQLKHLRMFDPM